MSKVDNQNRRKLTEFLIDHNITFSPSNNRLDYEATVKIQLNNRGKPKVQDKLELQIQQKIQDIRRQIQQFNKYTVMNTELKRKQKATLEYQYMEWCRLNEIYSRAHKFSESLMSIFRVVLHYHWFNNEFKCKNVKLEEIVNLFNSIFFNTPLAENLQKKSPQLIQFCQTHFKELRSSSVKSMKSDKEKQQTHNNSMIQNKSQQPKSSTPTNQATMEYLSTQQQTNYFVRIMQKAKGIVSNTTQNRSISPVSRQSRTPPSRVAFRV